MTNETHTHTHTHTHTPQKSRQLIIIGAGGHAVSVANVATSAGFTIHSFVDSNKAGQKLLGIDIIGNLEDFSNPDSVSFALAIGDNAIRQRVLNEIISEYGELNFPALIHSSAVISDHSSIANGVVVMPKAIVGPNSTVERFCLINTQASIDHDCYMREFASLAPGAITGGTVTIGNRTAISIAVSVKHGIKIGNDVVVGANSYVNKDLPDNTVAYGTPARVIRSRKVGEPYLK
jgi:sugar O-acyltransferase (sialic acid O-acetyltransferase NeuD family)